MPDNTNTVQITLSVKDDGTIKIIDQAKAKTDDLGEITERASAKGVSGLKAMKAGWLELAAGVTAGYFTIKKGIDVITNLVNVAAEAERIEKGAAFQIETWGYKFQEIKPYVDVFAESIQRTTRFSGEMARQGLGQMMQYTSSIEQGMKGVQLAMDITTRTGKDLRTTILYVGMAMNGEIEMLGKMDPAFKDLNNVLDENASKSEKAAFGLERLNKMFGGAGQADLKTYSGQVSQLRNEWDDLKKSMGLVLTPLAQGAVGAGRTMIGWLTPEGALKTELNYWQQIIDLLNVEDPYNTKAIEEAQAKITALTKVLTELEDKAKGAKAGLKDIIPEEIIKAPEKDWIKKWVEDFDGVTYALDKLGIKSTAVLSKEASDALAYAEVVKKAFEGKKASVRNYINALNVASDAMKKLTGEDTGKKREEAWDKNAETIKGISKDEEGWLKKVNKANDELFKTLKEIDKLEVPTHADVGPFEREVNAMKEKLRAEGLIIPVTTEGGTGGGGGKSPTWLGKPIGMSTGLSPTVSFDWPGLDEGTKAWNDFASQFPGGGKEFTIELSGKGSSKKPITEKIKEIIGEFGGLEKAMSGMEAEINVSELSLEYKKLDDKLNEVTQAFAQTANMMFIHGYSYSPDRSIFQQVTSDLMDQMKILQMKMGYERMKAYGGSYQTGIQYVPQTGQYTLHEGERVTTKNQISMGGVTNIFQIKSTDPKETANEVVHVLKYKLHGELNDLLRR